MAEKIYAPVSAKARDGRFGEEFSISFNVEKMLAFIKEHKTAKGYVNLKMNKRRDVGKFGETHSVTLDTWQPRQRHNLNDIMPTDWDPRASDFD